MQGFRLLILLTLLLSHCLPSNSQEYTRDDNQYLRIGVDFQFGTHIQRLGVMYQYYYTDGHMQITNGLYAHWNLRNLGPDNYPEVRFQFGVQGAWVDWYQEKYALNELSNITPYQNAIGYSFYVYWSGKELSQTTGALHGEIREFIWVIDNDALGLNQVDDKYRTGGLYLGYRSDSLLLGLQGTLWTGKSSDAPRVKDRGYPGRFGYRDVSEARYGNESHGILAVRADLKWDQGQVFRAEVGMDSERIRHALQNKLIHDGISGRLVKSESPHYPMLQKDGSPYLFKEDQKIKPPGYFLQLGANQPVFY